MDEQLLKDVIDLLYDYYENCYVRWLLKNHTPAEADAVMDRIQEYTNELEDK